MKKKTKNIKINLNNFLLYHLLVGGGVILCFILVFDLPIIILFLHCITIYSSYFLLYVLLQLIFFEKDRLRRILFSSYSLFIINIYIINSLSLSNWGSTVSLSFIWLYLRQVTQLLDEVYFALPLIILFSVICFTFFFKFYSRFNFKKNGIPKWNLFKYHYILSITTVVIIFFTLDPYDAGIWDGEPLTGLALHSTSTHKFIGSSGSSGSKVNYTRMANTNIMNRPNIIFIHLDAMRSDHMSLYGYKRKTTPFIDSIVDNGGQKLEMATSICSESICGIVAALGSNYIDKIPSNSTFIHHQLKKFGYKNIFIGTGNFSWENIDNILAGGIDQFLRSDQQSQYSIHDDFYILSELDKIPKHSGQSNFFFLRFLSSHRVGKHHVKYRKYRPSQKNIFSYLFPSIDSEVAINSYDNNIKQADDMARMAVDILKDKGYLQNYILVFYGDHGEALGEHGYFGHYKKLFQEEIAVPMIISSNNTIKLKEKEYATLLDIAPTVLDLANIPIPLNFSGKSLVSNINKLTFHSSRTGIFSVISKQQGKLYKLIYYKKKHKTIEIYELKKDPKEKNNIVKSIDPKLKLLLLNALLQYFSI